jgi:CubicO group peptidase (beta-lactamase class C family)
MTALAERGLATELATLGEAEMARWHVPGLAVGIYRDGNVETAAFGLASVETGQPVTPDTLFQIGSISMPPSRATCQASASRPMTRRQR